MVNFYFFIELCRKLTTDVGGKKISRMFVCGMARGFAKNIGERLALSFLSP